MTNPPEEEWDGPQEGGFALPLSGLTIRQIRIDYAMTFLFEEQSDLRIETDCTLWGDGDSGTTVDPNTEPTRWGPLLGVVNSDLVTAGVDGNAVLSLHFANGMRLEAQPSPRYESWTFCASTGQMLVCLARGEWAYFPDKVAGKQPPC